MGKSKVIFNGQMLIDLTGDTVTADKLFAGYTAHNAAGEPIIGTAQAGGGAPVVITPGDTPVLASFASSNIASSSYQRTGLSITIPVSGTYRFKYYVTTSASRNAGTQLRKNGTNVQQNTTWSNYIQANSYDMACNAGDVITVYASSNGSYYNTICTNLIACIDWDNGF